MYVKWQHCGIRAMDIARLAFRADLLRDVVPLAKTHELRMKPDHALSLLLFCSPSQSMHKPKTAPAIFHLNHLATAKCGHEHSPTKHGASGMVAPTILAFLHTWANWLPRTLKHFCFNYVGCRHVEDICQLLIKMFLGGKFVRVGQWFEFELDFEFRRHYQTRVISS
jgi:hypothetical protein